MFKTLLALTFLFISVYLFGFLGDGNHGHIMFRPSMLEDWILWGLVVLFGVTGLVIIIRQNIRRKKLRVRKLRG